MGALKEWTLDAVAFVRSLPSLFLEYSLLILLSWSSSLVTPYLICDQILSEPDDEHRACQLARIEMPEEASLLAPDPTMAKVVRELVAFYQ